MTKEESIIKHDDLATNLSIIALSPPSQMNKICAHLLCNSYLSFIENINYISMAFKVGLAYFEQ